MLALIKKNVSHLFVTGWNTDSTIWSVVWNKIGLRAFRSCENFKQNFYRKHNCYENNSLNNDIMISTLLSGKLHQCAYIGCTCFEVKYSITIVSLMLHICRLCLHCVAALIDLSMLIETPTN